MNTGKCVLEVLPGAQLNVKLIFLEISNKGI